MGIACRGPAPTALPCRVDETSVPSGSSGRLSLTGAAVESQLGRSSDSSGHARKAHSKTKVRSDTLFNINRVAISMNVEGQPRSPAYAWRTYDHD